MKLDRVETGGERIGLMKLLSSWKTGRELRRRWLWAPFLLRIYLSSRFSSRRRVPLPESSPPPRSYLSSILIRNLVNLVNFVNSPCLRSLSRSKLFDVLFARSLGGPWSFEMRHAGLFAAADDSKRPSAVMYRRPPVIRQTLHATRLTHPGRLLRF